MTYAQLEARVTAALKTASANFTAGDPSGFQAAVQQGVLAFGPASLAWFELGQSVTIPINSTHFALPQGHGKIFLPLRLRVGSEPWTGGQTGDNRATPMETQIDLLGPTATAALTSWAWQPPQTIWLGAPLTAETTVKLAGYCHGPARGDGTVDLGLGDEWLDCLAFWCAARILRVSGQGSSLEKAEILMAAAQADLQVLAAWRGGQ